MRKSYILLILFTLAITIALFLAACAKTGPKGATGPAGPQGSAGLQGTGGAQGAAGPAGSQIFEGNGVPADTLGNVGDFYINEANDSLYGPKTLSGWGNAISLQGSAGAAGAPGTPGAPGTAGAAGATGAAGAAGSQILSGSVPPTSTTGNPGDYYFDNLTDSLYGPKTSTGWGTAVSLRGSAGTPGAPGATGATGQTGATGPAGQTGAQGPPGSANVIYYNWTSFNPLTWGDFDPTYFRREYPINMPAITSQLLDQGVVLVYLEYIKVSNGDTTEQSVNQVPAIFYNVFGPTGTQKEYLTTELSTDSLNFYLSDLSDNNDPGELYVGTYEIKPPVTTGYLYRIILIPGGIAGTGIDPHQLAYKEVCTKYGIQP